MRILPVSALIGLSILCSVTRLTNSTTANPRSVLSDSHSILANAAHPQSSLTGWSTSGFALGNFFNLLPPVAVNDAYTVHGGSLLTPLQNDSAFGQSIHIQSFTQPAHGSVSFYTSSILSYGAHYGYVGPDSFNYTICNTQSECATATISIDIVNQPPIAATDFYTVHGGVQVVPRSNDSDPDGDSTTFHSIVTQPQHGSLAPYSNGIYTYGAHSGFTGSDSFTYRICDSLGLCSNGTVNLEVVNQAPVAVPDFYIVRGGIQVIPRSNDFDPDPQDSLTAPTILTQPQHGGLSPYNTNIFNYGPYSGYTGSDSFTYRVCDNLGACSIGTVTLWVIGSGENDGTMSCNARIGEPVNVTNGNMYVQQRDYQLPGVGHSLEVTRTYNSNSQRLGLFGRGWTTSYDESIVAYDTNLVRLNQPDGRAIYLGRGVGTSGALTALEKDFRGSLVQNGSSGFTLTMKDGSIHQFDSAGKLISLSDRNNNTTSLIYGGNGFLSSVTDPFGRVLTLTTNANGQVLSISDTMGTIANYTYGSSNQLLSVTYPDNSAFEFTYNASFRLTSVIDALGNVLEAHTYDSQGRAKTSEKQGGVERYTLTYVSSSRTDVTDALGHVTKYTIDKSKGRNVVTRVEGVCSCGGSGSQVQTWTYDNQLNVTTKTDALNHATTFTYDANGNRLTETDPTGTVTYTYNQFGDVLTRTDQMSGITTNTYDAQGNVLTTKDALNNTTTFTHDSFGQPLSVTDARGKVTSFTWDSSGRLTQVENALNQTTDFAYDSRGRLTGATNALSQTTSYEYDAAGRLKKTIFPDSTFVSYTYDLAGRRTKVTDARGSDTNFTYDSAYRVTSVTDALSQTTSNGYDAMSNQTSITDALGRVTNYEYDDFNRLKKVIYPPATSGATRLQELIEYDAGGNVKKKTDTAGRETTYTYDNVNRVIGTTDAGNKTTSFQYDALSRTTAVIDALNQQYGFSYDALGRQTQLTRASVSMSYAYDAVGNRTQRTDYNGAVTNYSYDDLNRLTTTNYPNTSTITYGYDALSRLTSATNANGTVAFGYDNRGRIAGATDVFNQVISYSYDANGNRTGMTLNASGYATHTYDAVNRLTNLADSANQSFPHIYDAANRLTARSAPNGVTTNYAYDGLSRLTALTHMAGATTLISNQYTYNNTNNISSWANASSNHTYGYDLVDRLASATNSAQPNENYSYDGVGNRTTSHLSATYSYQAFNKLTSTATASYTYDNNGNLLTKTDSQGTTTFTWNEENQLIQASLPGGLNVNYQYDGLGRRIQRTTSAGANERYVYDGQDVLLDLNADGSVATAYLNGPGIDNHLRQTSSTTGDSYYLTDHLGSTAGLTDATGNIREQLSYDSFGSSVGSAFTRYGYTGRERDPDTGLLYYRARFYDPQLGRFMSKDPIFLEGGINLYGYLAGNPLNFRDPLGLMPQNPPIARNAKPDQQARFAAVYKEVRRRLDDCDCSKALRGRAKALAALSGTSFSFEAVVGGAAETIGNAIRIDPSGAFMATDGRAPTSSLPNQIPSSFPYRDTTIVLLLGNRRTPGDFNYITPGDIDAGAFILLHELGHRVRIYGQNNNDGTDPVASALNNEKIRKACFKELKPQPLRIP